MTTKTLGWHRIAIFILGCTGALLARGCGSVTDSRVEARNEATQHTCDQYQACGAIGPGLSYPDQASCTTAWQANWDTAWPAADCQGKIDQAQLHFCLSAIDGTSCTSLLDIADTIYVKCGKATVCDVGATPADAAIN